MKDTLWNADSTVLVTWHGTLGEWICIVLVIGNSDIYQYLLYVVLWYYIYIVLDVVVNTGVLLHADGYRFIT
jgi:hypothetical protein